MLMMKNHHRINLQSTDSTTIATTAATVVAVPVATDNTSSGHPYVRKKERPLISINIPPFVTKLEDTRAGGKFLCNPCQAHCNSDIQLSQHLSSKKHQEKMNRKMNTVNGGMGEMCHLTEVTERPTNKSVMDIHLTGSKHQRKLKSIELVKSLEGTEPGFKFDTATGEALCTLCDVTFYSPQHVTRHVEGEKHKAEIGKRENGEEGGTPAKKLCAVNTDQPMGDSGQSSTSFEVSEGNAITTITSTSMSPALPPKKERPLLNINIPPCVTKVEDSKAGGKFLCNPCQAHCNSDIQLSQHLSSKKHLDKVSGKRRPPMGGGGGSGRGWKGSPFGRGRGGASTQGGSGIPSLASVSSISAYSSGGNASGYNQPTFPDSSLSSSYGSDSYGLSSLGRGTVSDYGGGGGFGRSSGPGRGGAGRGSGGPALYGRNELYSRSEPYTRSEPYSRPEGGYGRGVSAYGRATDTYSRHDYINADFTMGRTEDLNVYGRPPATENVPQGYGAPQNLGHVGGRGMPFTYTQPLSQSFVSGGTIL